MDKIYSIFARIAKCERTHRQSFSLYYPELASESMNAFNLALTSKTDIFRNKFGMTAHRGFTLAEVLITLGIIGVVSAMTIPTLIQDYNTRVWSTSSQVFEKKLTEALKVMNTQSSLAGHSTTESFVQELSKHFKITKICKNNEISLCFGDEILWEVVNISEDTTSESITIENISTAQDLGQLDWNTEAIGVQFANGVSAVVAYNDYDCFQDPYSNQITGQNCLAMIYDTNGLKNPNTTQKDVRGLNSIINKCSFRSNSTCYSTPFNPAPHFWNSCQDDGTSTDPDDLAFMSEYGIRQCCWAEQCSSRGDFWAGAVKACGGTSKLATSNEIAKYLYPSVENINNSWYSYHYCPKDENDAYTSCRKDASSIGITPLNNKNMYIFSGTEAYNNGMMYWQYSPTYAGFHYSFRYASDFSAICISD